MRTPLRLLAGLSLFVFVAIIACAQQARAFGCRPNLIPNGNQNLCSNCHFNPRGGGPRNPFGVLVDEVAIGCDPFWGPELAATDPDGDGRTSGEELQDPLGEWRPGLPAPGNPDLVTLPGVADDPPPEPGFLRGDADSTDAIDLSDAITILNVLFLGTGELACHDAADANGDLTLNIADPVYILFFLFFEGPSPPPPFPDCGPVPPEESLGCEHPGC